VEFRLSIVIVTYNSASVLPGLLDSLVAGLEGIKQFETIVVDNDSADDSVDIALAHAIRPRVIRMGRNAGYAAAILAMRARNTLPYMQGRRLCCPLHKRRSLQETAACT